MKHSNTRATAMVVVALISLASGIGIGYQVGDSSPDTTKAPSSRPTFISVASRASATEHNNADATFAQTMVPHHEQALAMAKLAETRAGSDEVKQLAATIESAQQPEIDQMNSWLEWWGAGSGMSSPSSMSGMHHSNMSMGDGMMSQTDMDKLATLTGTAFDREFLTRMISHHQGAVSMAQAELKDGQDADSLALAASIQLTQQAQIRQMQGLLEE